MARKPEATYRNSVHKHLDKSIVYFAPMGGSYVAGIPDMYYEGPAGSLWVEWKNFQVLPSTIDLTKLSSRAKLSALQQQWLIRGHKNSVKTAVICGSPLGGVVYEDLAWQTPLTKADFIQQALSRKDIALWITQQVAGP